MKFHSNMMPLNSKKMQFKVPENAACLPEVVIYEVKKGVKESLITQGHPMAPLSGMIF